MTTELISHESLDWAINGEIRQSIGAAPEITEQRGGRLRRQHVNLDGSSEHGRETQPRGGEHAYTRRIAQCFQQRLALGIGGDALQIVKVVQARHKMRLQLLPRVDGGSAHRIAEQLQQVRSARGIRDFDIKRLALRALGQPASQRGLTHLGLANATGPGNRGAYVCAVLVTT